MKKTFKLPLPLLLCILLTATSTLAHETGQKGMIGPVRLAEKLSHYQIIDIRTYEEYTALHIPSAVSLPLLEISQQKLQSLGITNNKPVVLYGASANTPKKAKLLLEVLGYSDISILTGGFTHWVEDGKPTESGDSERGGSAVEKAKKVLLEILPESYDFGKIEKKNGVVSTLFQVRNAGEGTVKVVNITTSCGCTSAEMENMEIEPGTVSKLRVFFDPNFHKEPEGRFSRTVFLQLASGAEIELKIFVEIVNKNQS